MISSNMISSVSDKSNKFGTSHSPEYDMEAAIRLKPGFVGQELVINQTFLSAVVGFCYGEKRKQNRAKKGFQTCQLDRTLHQSFYPLQHRYTKLLSWPVVAVLIGVLVALLVFGFYPPSTRSIATTASQAASRISHGQAEAAVHSRLDGGFQSRLLRFVKNAHQSRVARAGMVFEQKVLDSLQRMFWVGEQGSGDADNARGRQLLQAQSKAKYLRGYAELGAELTKKKRMRKYKNKPPKDPYDVVARKLFKRFPGWQNDALFFLFQQLYLNLDMDAITRFFIFCDEFPTVVGMMGGFPILVIHLFYLQDTLGHADFTALFISFPAFVFMLALFLHYFPQRVYRSFLHLLSSLPGKKRS